jgi:dihydropteroate synthase
MQALRDLPFPAVMGVINVTPDSFSDAGLYADPDAAVRHGVRLVADGADLLDVGGESTRPGSDPVSAAEEIDRVLPVVRRLRNEVPVPISIDTMKSEVAGEALAAGASMVNDVSALRHDPLMAGVIAHAGACVCLMHMKGTPKTMQVDPRYDDVVAEVGAFLGERARVALAAGITAERICVDPGIGFGKTLEHNIRLLRELGSLVELGYPVLVGVSRKRFLGAITGRDESHRLAGTVGANVAALERGASIFRVHDVRPNRDALDVAAAIVGAG